MPTTSGGDKLGEALRGMAGRLSSAKSVKVGFLGEAPYPGGARVALVAAVQNYGAPSRGIPPRPFFTDMVKKRSKEWPAAIAGLLKDNDYDARKTLELVGEDVRGQLQQAIRDAASPPYKALARSTVRRKGFDKLLFDTGHMLNSVDKEVEE